MSRNITNSIQTLTKQHHNVVQKYKEKNALYIKNYDKWTDFNKNFSKIQAWIESTLVKLNELNETSLDTERVQEIIKVSLIYEREKKKIFVKFLPLFIIKIVPLLKLTSLSLYQY